MARRVENQLLLHSHTGPVTGDLLDILKKKKMQGTCNQRKNSPLLLLLKKNKQTNKSKNKKNKSLVSISNVGDQLWLGLVLKLPLIFNNVLLVLIFRADVLIFHCFFNTVHS